MPVNGPAIRSVGVAGFVGALALGCGASSAPSASVASTGARSSDVARGVFEPGEALGYVVRDPKGRVVGRLHSRFFERAGEQTIVTRAAFGRPALDLERLVPDRTIERATVLGPQRVIRLKLLSSEDGLRTYAYEDNAVIQSGPLASRSRQDPDPKALPVHPDDPAVLAMVVERSGLRPGQSARVPVRAEDPIAVQSWPMQVFVDSRRTTVVRLPLGEARLDSRGRIRRLILKSGVTYERLADPGPMPELLQSPDPMVYRRPSDARFVDRAVRVEVDAGVLAGVLSAPVSARTESVPGVVFFSDLGPQNRHGFGSRFDAGTWQILDDLANAGFAVLRLDDRGVGASRSTVPRESVDAALARRDAEAVVRFMARQPEVRPESISVVGHGFGAHLAVASAASPDVSAVVLVAPAVRSPVSVLAERWVTLDGGDLATRSKQLTAFLSSGSADAVLVGMSAAIRSQLYDERRWLSALGTLFEPASKLDKPIAVLQGMKDFEVSWRRDARALVRVANASRKNAAKLFIYEYADHLLKIENQPSKPDRYRDRGRRVEPRVLRDLVEWLSRLGPTEP